jgi:transcriptional regulator with XRE-family HTH domain
MEFRIASAAERSNFSERLKSALRAKNIAVKPSKLARSFNLMQDGWTVTPHAVRKWLVGEAIPTQDKILVLAKWLDVSAGWLRFGDVDSSREHGAGQNDDGAPDDGSAIVRELPHLSAPSKKIVKDLETLKRLEDGSGRGDTGSD